MQISNEIIEVLDYLGNKLGLAIDWSSENVIPYVEQLCGRYISWEVATSIAWIVISILVIVIVAILNKICDGEGFLLVTTIIVAATIIIIQSFDVIECATFPEKAIFEYIQNYIANHS